MADRTNQLTLIARAPDGRRPSVIEMFHWAAGRARTLPGLVTDRVLVEARESDCVYFVTEWRSWVDLEAFVGSALLKRLIAGVDDTNVEALLWGCVVEPITLERIEMIRNRANRTNGTHEVEPTGDR